MIINSFILCGGATFTDIGTVDIKDAGILDATVPVADDWQPGQPFGFEVSAVLFAQHQNTDTAEQPYVTVHLRSDTPESGRSVQILLSGWRDGVAGTRFIHETFPLQFVLNQEGDYLVTVHPEGMDNETAAAVYPLRVSVLKSGS